MTLEIGLLLALIAAALVLFSAEIVSPDVAGLGILIALVITGLLEPEEAFAGFGSSTVLLILGLLVMTAALSRTGVVDIASRYIQRRTTDEPRRTMGLLMSAVASLSTVISNTAATAFFLPVTLNIAKKIRANPSRLLMPLAFGSILSSSVTLVSSSTNIVISGLLVQYQMEPLRLLELTPVGIPVALVGLAYMYTIGSRLIPVRETDPGLEDPGSEVPYSTEIVVQPGSPLIGHPVDDPGLNDRIDLTVTRIREPGGQLIIPPTGRSIAAGDTLLVQTRRDELLRVKDIAGIDIKVPEEPQDGQPDPQAADVVEGILLPGSPLVGYSLKSLRFAERYGLKVLGLHRSGRTIQEKISETRLRVGDQLIIQGEPAKISLLSRNNNFRIISGLGERLPNIPRARTAVLIFLLALVLGSTGLVPLTVAVLAGVVFTFLTRTITPEEAYREVDWRVLVLIGCMLALGRAMEVTGTASYLAGLIVQFTGGMPLLVQLGGFFLLTVLLTQPMSNQAAAVVVLPVAVQTALQLGANPRTFAVMIAVAASTSFMTPLEPSCMMVYNPGNYRFSDFVRVGTPLTLIIFAISLLLVPLIWPLHP